jgi:catechol 2,3-dioxygenase-like lactoylglutathione lyase family enzyme
MNTITNFRIKKMSPQLLVADIERSVEFYTKKLGFDVDFRHEDFYTGIIKDGFSIHLKSSELQTGKRKVNEDLDILFSVDGIKDLYEELSGRGIEIVQPLRDMDYGTEFYVADPDGNVIAFLEA